MFTSIDRWGYLPLPPRPLTAGSIAATHSPRSPTSGTFSTM
ncbi:hypothetical protein [Prescottella agglutinans]